MPLVADSHGDLVLALTTALQQASETPLLIAVDQEGEWHHLLLLLAAPDLHSIPAGYDVLAGADAV